MSCFMEIMFYLMLQLCSKKLSEDDNFKSFKEILLRHSVLRPPHSLAIFNLDDVKKIEKFALESFYRHYDMYKQALLPKEMLVLKT
jgi:hypothetical protein